MAMKLYPDTAVQAIANAIRAKNGSSDTYSIGEMAQAITNLPSGGGTSSVGRYTKFASGTVTFTSRYQTTGNRLIVSLANIGFTPEHFIFIASPQAVTDIREALIGGTEANGVVIYSDYTKISNGTNTYHSRKMVRISGTGASSSGSANQGAWTTQTNYYLYNNGTNIYFRTASNYGLMANTTYEWIAMAE